MMLGLQVSLSSHGLHIMLELIFIMSSHHSHFLLNPESPKAQLNRYSLHVHVATETTGAGVWFHTGQLARQLLAWPALKTAAAYHG
jgi:hypothetical protein